MRTKHTGSSYEDTEVLSVGPAAAILGVSPDTLKRYERDGLIASRRTPTGHRRFLRADVEQLRDSADRASA
ncbi:helix-turn-helix domain-containing protein [Nocardia puris]|uniref:MerR family transcriptional regulator n=1 Tax=Nocardia puris TaxID=208602 RepID=UPI0018936F51|nr:helix-turn-helix domain-containing protein [Nocardia puris]MBF6213705.1 helix-turn-helix domain-containing protein [Nocardia puris]